MSPDVCALALVAAAAILLPMQARADPPREAALFERPVSFQRVPARSDTDPVGEINCTYYTDFMIRETGTNTPAANTATLIRGANPVCDASRAAGSITLKTAAYGLIGRIGSFLAFEAADPNGASAFMVVDAENGRTLYSDGLLPGGIHAVAVEGSLLRIRFTRAVNLSCSILKDGAACWAKMVAERKIPRAFAQTPPPVQACMAAYRNSKDAPDDPSEIHYEVDMMLGRSGKAQVVSRGAMGCLPMP